jgi:ATP-dependent DNA helicase UvrD/PcrA
VQVGLLTERLRAAGVDHESPREESFINTEPGRFSFSILRILCDRDDYVAHRGLLGLLPGVGPGTCGKVADVVLSANIRYRDIFYAPLPPAVFGGRMTRALTRARGICAHIAAWRPAETLSQRSDAIAAMLRSHLGEEAAQSWTSETAHLPREMTLEEVRNYLWADNDEQQARILEAVYQRLALDVPQAGFLPAKVRIMTMHGAKGLDATVVFIPGLEEDIVPGSFRRGYPGLVLEAARLLYVSITRARAACVMSYAESRLVYGRIRRQTYSPFLTDTGGAFARRAAGLTEAEVGRIMGARANLA